jgi:hypothetical protein
MKRILLSLLLPLLALPLLAQQEQRALYVFRNDGAFNAFLFESIDSITYSQYDADSILCENYVIQDVWEGGSVTRIPLASIDSISYQTPDNVVKTDVVVCSEELFSHIIESDSVSITFDAWTPASLMPLAGCKFVIEEMSALFPHALAARIDRVVGKTVYYTEISPTEIYDVYYNIQSYHTSSSADARRRLSDGQNKTHKDLEPYEFTKSIDDIEQHLKLTDEWSFGVGGKCELSVRAEPHVDVTRVILYGDEFVDYHSTCYFTTTSNIKLYGSISYEKEWEVLDKGWTIPIPYVPFFEVYFAFTPFVSVSATGAVEYERTVTHVTHYHHSYSTNENLKDLTSTTVEPLLGHDNEYTKSFAGELEVSAGAALEMGFRVKELKNEKKDDLFNLDKFWMLRLYARGDLGVRVGVKVPFSKYIYKKYKDQGSKLYDAIRDDMSIHGNWFTGFEWGMKWQVFHWEGKWAHDRVEWDLGTLFDKSLFPWFHNTEIVDSQTDDGELRVKCGIEEDLVLGSTEVGFIIVDEDEREVCKITKEEHYEKENFHSYELPIPKGVSISNQNCKVYPYFVFMDCPIKASPSVDLNVKVVPNTDDATKLAATQYAIAGHVEGKIEYAPQMEVGFFFGTSSNPKETGTRIATSLGEDKTFLSEINDLNYGTEYYYCAYLKMDGKYSYGRTYSFKTDKVPDNAIDLGLSVLWAKWNIGANSDSEPGGLYGWADPTGTNTSYNVLNENGTVWASSLYGGAAPPTTICGTQLDIATAKWGGDWRLPTEAEMTELIDLCSWDWSVSNGTPGMTVTGPNGNSIFLPAGGDRFGTEQREFGEYGYYWTGTLNTEETRNAYRLEFDDWGASCTSYARYIGHLIRPVMNKPQ